MTGLLAIGLAAAAGLAQGLSDGPNNHACMSDLSRRLPFCDVSLSVEKRLDDLMSRLNISEKIAQITPQHDLGGECTTFTRGAAKIGIPEWLWLVETNTNIASGCPEEGKCATTFVGPTGLGASFNRTSWRLKGSVFGNEMRALTNIRASRFQPDGKNPIGLTGFGPNINIVRDPRFGRNSEVPGEDPFLSGTYAFEMVSGMQEKDVHGYPKMAAFLKHFTAYSTETNRGHDTYNISAYDFFDTYLPQYEHAFSAQPFGVMCSYNAENGRPSCANDWLLNKQLRSWKPDAMVTTDCGAVNNLKGPPVNAPDDVSAAAFALMNGTDLEMGDDLFQHLEEAIKRGLATEARLDEAVRRSFKVLFDVGRFDPPESTEWAKFGIETLNSSLHQQISYEAALQSLVLLKNDVIGGVQGRTTLPLKQGSHVAVVGPQGVTRNGLLSDYAADQQCFTGDDHCIISIAEGIASANSGGITVSAQGVEVNSNKTDGIKEALDIADKADVVVLVLGNDKSIEHEGQDRSDTALPGIQLPFAKQILALNKTVVVVLTNGGALAIDELMVRSKKPSPPGSQVPGYAIVEAFNPGVVGGKAVGASLFGLENRWGKLPITMYPHDYIKQQSMVNYDMSAPPGRTYKYYNGTPLYSFGFGLSLTSFRLHSCDLGPSSHLFNSVNCTVTNTGNREGDEVVQIYHVAHSIGKVDHPLPKRALVGFTRVTIPAESSTSVSFSLSVDTLKVVNQLGVRTLYPGTHLLIVSRGSPGDEQILKIEVPSTYLQFVV